MRQHAQSGGRPLQRRTKLYSAQVCFVDQVKETGKSGALLHDFVGRNRHMSRASNSTKHCQGELLCHNPSQIQMQSVTSYFGWLRAQNFFWSQRFAFPVKPSTARPPSDLPRATMNSGKRYVDPQSASNSIVQNSKDVVPATSFNRKKRTLTLLAATFRTSNCTVCHRQIPV